MLRRPLAAALVLALLCGCAAHAARAPRTTPHRIVSLIPSLTQDLCAIGAGGDLVGVSAYSRGIACAAGLPRVGDFASVDAERIVALHPDLVVAIAPQARFLPPLRRAGIRTALLRDDTFDDIFLDIERLGELTGRSRAARLLIARLRAQTRRLERSEHVTRRPSVFIVLGVGPIWTAGPASYISTLIRQAGGRNAVTSLPSAYAEYSEEALLLAQPDVIVTDRMTHLASVLGREPWRSLRAVRRRRVYVLNDPAILEQPGPRYNEGIRWLIARLQPRGR